jgi:hypothetical protein
VLTVEVVDEVDRLRDSNLLVNEVNSVNPVKKKGPFLRPPRFVVYLAKLMEFKILIKYD